MFERHLAREVRGHHDHACHPEEDDVVAGDQDAGGQVQIAVRCFVGPAHGAKGHQCGRVPGVQHIGISREGFARRLGLCIGFVVRHIHLAIFVVPSGNLVAPPELAADTPIGDVVHPLVVGVDPVLWHKLHFARLHRINGFLRNAFACGVLRADVVHGHKPLVGQHGFHHLAGASANRQHHFVRFDLQHQTHGFQVGIDGFARNKSVHPLVSSRAVLVDFGVQGEDGDERQVVALRTGVVIEVVGAGDLHAARAEFAVNEVIGNDGDLAVAQRQVHHLAQKMFVAFVFRMHRQRAVGHHGLGSCGGNRHAFLHHAVNQLRSLGKGVADVVHVSVRFGGFDFQVGHRAHQHWVPIDQALATVNQALLVQLDKGVGDHGGQFVVHGEVLAAPVHAVAHAAHLLGDGVARLLFPLPHLGNEIFTRYIGCGSHVVAADALALQLALHHDLGGNARMVGARYPHRVKALHAVVARQAVHDGLVERVPHVQGTRHVRWRQLNGKRGSFRLGLARAAKTRHAVAALFPFRAPVGF